MESNPLIVGRGDFIRFSVALLRQIYEERDHVSILMEVVEVRLDPEDGSKILVLSARDRSTWNKKWNENKL